VLTGLADVLREQELYREATEIYGQAIDLDHEAIAPQLGAAATLARAGNTPMARRAYNTLLGSWDYAQDRVRLAAAAFLVTAREWDSALEMYERVEIPGNGALPALLALYGKGYCLLQLGRPAEAEYFLSLLIERVPRDYDGPARGREFLFQAYEDLAGYFEGRGRAGKVESLLQSACARPLAPSRLARRLAEIFKTRAREDEAARLLERTITNGDPQEDPLELAESAILLARLRSGGGRRPPAAGSPALAALARAAERIEPSPLGPAHYRLARAQALAGQPQAALDSLRRARDRGYLPRDQAVREPDFQALRREPAFEALWSSGQK
jgi:tetratricopeptide (TPR) repeat protein